MSIPPHETKRDLNINTENALSKKLEQALALQQDNQSDAAMAIFQEILSQLPEQPDALHGIGLLFAQRKDFQQAVKYLQQAIRQAPHIAEFHNNLANAFKAIGKTDEAMMHYREALRLKASYPQAHNNLGALLYKIGKYNEAATHFQKSLRIDPHSVDTHYNLANCYIQLDKLLDAVAHFQEVLKLRPDHLGALHNLGITLCVLKQFQEALPLLQKVIKREPNNIDALFHLGVIYSAAADPNAAKMCYEQVLSLDPNHGNSHHNLATVYLHLQQSDKALKHYQEALRIEPNNNTARHMIDALTGKTNPAGAPIEYTRALFDQYAYNYDEHVKKKLKYQVPQILREAITPFVQNDQGPLTILDLGCGSGLCAPLFSDIAGKMIGVDVSSNMIEVARQRGGYYKLFATDILTFLEKCSAEYDVIISADVLVYFGSLQPLFTACYRALKAKGLFCFSIETLMDKEISAHPTLPDFQLRYTGRTAHSSTYIDKLVKTCQFNIVADKKAIIRYQEDLPVEGHIYILKK